MTRKAANLQFITDEPTRKVTFKKWKNGVMKKANELTILCGIEACVLVYGPYDAKPEVWPSPAGAEDVLSRFKKMSEMEKRMKMLDQEGFMKQRLAKVTAKLSKVCKDNREMEMTEVMSIGLAGNLSLEEFTLLDVNDLKWVIDQRLMEVKARINAITKGPGPQVPSSSTVTPPAGAANSEMQDPQWLTDMMNKLNNVGLGSGAAGDDTMLLPFGDNEKSGSSNQNLP